MSVHVLFEIPTREGLGIDVLQTSQLGIKTLSSMDLSVKNSMQLYTIEKSQMIADDLRALSSLSCERSLEGSRPRFAEQLHSPQE